MFLWVLFLDAQQWRVEMETTTLVEWQNRECWAEKWLALKLGVSGTLLFTYIHVMLDREVIYQDKVYEILNYVHINTLLLSLIFESITVTEFT